MGEKFALGKIDEPLFQKFIFREDGKVQIFITLCTLHFRLDLVDYSDELSNYVFIKDYVKVVDFIEEMAILS